MRTTKKELQNKLREERILSILLLIVVMVLVIASLIFSNENQMIGYTNGYNNARIASANYYKNVASDNVICHEELAFIKGLRHAPVFTDNAVG